MEMVPVAGASRLVTAAAEANPDPLEVMLGPLVVRWL
jgi:hypothetical protein